MISWLLTNTVVFNLGEPVGGASVLVSDDPLQAVSSNTVQSSVNDIEILGRIMRE